ncbi:MAG: methyltransferase domain-containing protein [Acholeplasma sp.]|nr:methyltransferase domain-containing protein [Acholeplasma sp.]
MTNQKKLDDLKLKALENHIPILSDDGLLFLIKTILDQKAKTVLEVGTAVGYSAIAIALLTGCKVVSIERDEIRYQEALLNIKSFDLSNQITVILEDALNLELETKFDCVFIDAAKAQYEKFFTKYQKNLSENGFIIADNLNFHHLDITKVSRSTRNLIKRLNAFKVFLKNNEAFDTTFTDIGDGMSVSVRKSL